MKSKQKINFIILLSFLVFPLSTCVIENVNSPQDIPTNQFQAFPSPTPTSTDNFSPDTEYIDAARLQLNCSDTVFIDERPEKYPWLFAIQSGQGFHAHLWDINTDVKSILYAEDSASFKFSTSPDGKMFAFEEMTGVNEKFQSKVVVMDSNMKTIIEIPEEEDGGFYYILFWADQNHLWLIKSTDLGDPDFIYSLNPKTGNIEEYPIRFSNQYDPSLYPNYLHDFSTLNSVYYSPTLEHFVYSLSNGSTYALCDIRSGNECIQIPGDFAFIYPDWAPDGNSFVVAQSFSQLGFDDIPKQELFQIDIQGNVNRLTFLSNYFHKGVDIDNYSWSPNGKMIGFRFYDEAGSLNQKQFGLYDFETGLVTQFCFNSDTDLIDPIWSPDSKYIVLNESYLESHNNNVYLIDLEKMEIMYIGKDMFVVGLVEKPLE